MVSVHISRSCLGELYPVCSRCKENLGWLGKWQLNGRLYVVICRYVVVHCDSELLLLFSLGNN